MAGALATFLKQIGVSGKVSANAFLHIILHIFEDPFGV